MYYLKWVNQTIPSSAVGARNLLPVWNAEVLLRAKDDFVGGNVLNEGANTWGVFCGYIEPLSAVIFSVAFLGEKLLFMQIIGAVLIIGGAITGEYLTKSFRK